MCRKSKSGLRDLLTRDHSTTSDLRAAVDDDATRRFWKELADLLIDLGTPASITEGRIRRLQNKAAAIEIKVVAARGDQSNQDCALWVKQLFERNASLAHKWTNAPNTESPMRVAKDGTLSKLSHLDDQHVHAGLPSAASRRT